MGAVLGREPRRFHTEFLQRLGLQLLDAQPLLGAEYLAPVN